MNLLSPLLVSALLLVAACAPVAPFRSVEGVCEMQDVPASQARKACEKHFVEKHDGFDVAYVELSDMGLFLDRRQLESALKLAEPRGTERVDVIVYVHGWLHNAEYKDADVSDFVRNAVSAFHDARPAGENRRTVGIFVGWRGNPLKVPGLDKITFYDRKGAADHVARGSVRELLARLRATKLATRSDSGAAKVSVVAVGHSFGGLILFNAIAGSIMDAVTQTQQAAPGSQAVPTLYDSAILINPAFEAVRFEPVFQAALFGGTAAGQYRWQRSQAPLLVSITSTGDWATKYAFPLGRFVNSVFEHEGQTDQDGPTVPAGDWVEKRSNRNTMGHLERYLTHTLTRDTGAQQLNCTPTANPLLRDPTAFPLWTIRADPSVIKDHSDIWNPFLWRYLAAVRDLGPDAHSLCGVPPNPALAGGAGPH